MSPASASALHRPVDVDVEGQHGAVFAGTFLNAATLRLGIPPTCVKPPPAKTPGPDATSADIAVARSGPGGSW